MTGLSGTLLSLGVLFALLFLVLGLRGLMRRQQPPLKNWLMIALALVTLLNIWLYADMLAR